MIDREKLIILAGLALLLTVLVSVGRAQSTSLSSMGRKKQEA